MRREDSILSLCTEPDATNLSGHRRRGKQQLRPAHGGHRWAGVCQQLLCVEVGPAQDLSRLQGHQCLICSYFVSNQILKKDKTLIPVIRDMLNIQSDNLSGGSIDEHVLLIALLILGHIYCHFTIR